MEFAGRKIAAGESKTANAERKMELAGSKIAIGKRKMEFAERKIAVGESKTPSAERKMENVERKMEFPKRKMENGIFRRQNGTRRCAFSCANHKFPVACIENSNFRMGLSKLRHPSTSGLHGLSGRSRNASPRWDE